MVALTRLAICSEDSVMFDPNALETIAKSTSGTDEMIYMSVIVALVAVAAFYVVLWVKRVQERGLNQEILAESRGGGQHEADWF
jgi:hypothetical protein